VSFQFIKISQLDFLGDFFELCPFVRPRLSIIKTYLLLVHVQWFAKV
jgi:hypothetical protein